MWGKTCNRPSGALSSESTSQILYVLEGGVSYFSTQYAIRNQQLRRGRGRRAKLMEVSRGETRPQSNAVSYLRRYGETLLQALQPALGDTFFREHVANPVCARG